MRVLRRAPPDLIFCAAAVLSGLAYLAASRVGGYIGFPLDDAWIHQTYARNLAATGQMAFMPGEPSAGSTSPLWTAMLAVGYMLRIDYRVFTFGTGLALLAANAALAYRLVRRWWPDATGAPLTVGAPLSRGAAFGAGLFVALEWHMVWAALSGMETLLYSAGALLVLALPLPRRAGLAGVVAGLTMWARPEAVLLLPFQLARGLLSGKQVIWPAAKVLLGWGAAAAPFLLLNQWLGGSVWPNTFYAKQAEYLVLQQAPILARVGAVGVLPFVGAQALLLPGIIAALWLARPQKPANRPGLHDSVGSPAVEETRARNMEIWLAAGWCLAVIGAYALRLPVTYQHGRYVIPLIPTIAALGAGGLQALLRPNAPGLSARVVGRGWLAALALLTAVFWGRGALAYQTDVQVIETEMVAGARWVRDNSPPEALVAAHDIGALGYFGGRRLLDLAGLVSPEVIPFIRDEGRLRQWLNEKGADFLVTFPGWYPVLVAAPESRLVYSTGAPFSPRLGGENMAVYAWQGRAGPAP